jgi:hypothetical protein
MYSETVYRRTLSYEAVVCHYWRGPLTGVLQLRVGAFANVSRSRPSLLSFLSVT